MAGARVVYSSRANPWNSEPVVFMTVRSARPETTAVRPSASWWTTQVRTPAPERTKECRRSPGSPAGVIRSQEYSSISTRACRIDGWEPT